MEIRKYVSADCQALLRLFFDTVHAVNAKEYTEKQLAAWATGHESWQEWNQSFLAHSTLVAVEGETIVGFGDIAATGYLDRLYVHKDYQGRGIATALCNLLEQAVSGVPITTHASITAKPFFAKRGYKVVTAQEVERNGVFLTNYSMEKY